MKMKRILLVTFLLLAVLTIGAASAEDNNATSDDLQVADDGDDVVELTGYDEDKHYIDVNSDEDIDLKDDENSIADICLPYNTQKGSFRIYNGNVEVAHTDIDFDDDDHWDNDEDEKILNGYLYVGDLDLDKIHDGDNLTFKFFEPKSGSDVEDVRFTVVYGVTITGSTMVLTESEGSDDAEGEIHVKNIDLSKPDENFTWVIVTERIGTFIITLDDNDDTVIFKENLGSTKRNYTELDDEDYGTCYRFDFSLADINSYIAQNSSGVYSSIDDLITYGLINNEDEMYFDVLKDEDDEDSEIASDSWTVILEDGKIIFYYDDEEKDVEVESDDFNIVMDDGWNETVVLNYTVKRGIKGNIIIYLNDDESPVFNRTLSECTPYEYEEDDEEDVYQIKIADLNITKEGEYVLKYYFVDEKGVTICSYDVDYPDTLVLLPSQTSTGENATIWVNPVPISVDENQIIIKINATDAQAEDEVIIYIDGNETPITIEIGECLTDDEGNYTIMSDQLNLGVGKHELNITCRGTNSIANVTILTDLEIELADETVYTTFNKPFVLISLKNDEITGDEDITGLINVTITDSEGKVISAVQKDIEDDAGIIDFELGYLVIRPNDMDVELNGTYAVSVIYYNGNKGFVQAEGNVTFKALEADEYGVSISDKIVDDRIITFDDVPFDNRILVEIDDSDTPVTFEKSNLFRGLDSQNKTIYFISQDQLNLTDGSHSIKVSIENGFDAIELANVNVTVDLKENADPALTVSVANIEVGNAATVLITTNSSFTGNVKVQVANKTYDVNVTNGQGNVSVTGLDVGEYIATATFEADVFFNASVKTAAFNVTAKPVTPGKENTTPVTPAKEDTKPVAKKTKVKLTLKKVKVKRSAKKLVLTATLKINGKAAKKKKITFKFKGKKYKAKTNKKGVAKVTIKKKVLKKLKKGKKVKIQASYGKTVKKYTVKVRK